MRHFNLLLLMILGFSLLWTWTSKAQDLDLQLVPFASGISLPVDIVHAGDDRLFVVTQDGTIVIVQPDGTVNATPFLDITDRTGRIGFEQGLLGLAFHPNYSTNGYFYVNYTTLTGGTTHIARFTVSGNPDIANASSEQVLMTVPQPFSNHNAGDLAFGPDGYLYFGLGDGGSGGDPGNRSQNPQELLGKIIRIDVDNGLPYTIPPTNPFVNDATTLDEIWAIGVRNPWRISFDQLTGDLWMGDVGQNVWEEINWQPANSMGGENYGWRCFEGPAVFDNNCSSINAVSPVSVQSHNDGHCSITGGFVYRGVKYPNFYGHYVYTDYCSGDFWTVVPDGAGNWTTTFQKSFSGNFSTFGEDQHGELYVADLFAGDLYKLIDSSLVLNIVKTNEDCNGNLGSIDLTIGGGEMPYHIQWSNNSTDEDLINLTAGTYTVTVTDDDGRMATDSYTVLPPPGFTLTLMGTDEDCDSNLGSIDLIIDGNTMPYDIQWSNNSTDEDLINLTAGTYTVTVTDQNNCTATDSYTVQPPPEFTIALMGTDEDCDGNLGSIDLTINDGEMPFDIQWSNNSTDEDLINLTAGTYTVTVTDQNNCTATDSNTVQPPPEFTITLMGTDEDCDGNLGSIDLTINDGEMPYDIQWSNASTDEDLMNLSADTYTVTVTDNNNCIAIDAYTVLPPVNCDVVLQLQILLEGAFNNTSEEMNTFLRNGNLLPATHPFSDPIWNHTGTESVANIADIPTDAVDWVLVQLVDGQGSIVVSKAAFLLKDGSLRDISEVTNPISGGLTIDPTMLNANSAYQIQVYTRNHVAIASSTTILLDLNQTNQYDFTSDASNTLNGDKQLTQLLDGRWALSAGDIATDGIVNIEDFNKFVSENNSTGYLNSDLNFDNRVNGTDFTLLRNHLPQVGVQPIRK